MRETLQELTVVRTHYCYCSGRGSGREEDDGCCDVVYQNAEVLFTVFFVTASVLRLVSVWSLKSEIALGSNPSQFFCSI